MTVRGMIKSGANWLLGHSGLRIVSDTDMVRYDRTARRYAETLAATLVPDVKLTESLLQAITELLGTEIGEAMFLLDRLGRSLDGPGDICEFGVAQGATSALIAERLREEPSRTLWLYDTFAGLPAPSARDRLIDDPLRLERIDGYAGSMASDQHEVTDRLDRIGFPRSRVRIVPGRVTAVLEPAKLPETVAFAYVDFDFYEGTRDVLALLHDRLAPGGHVLIDDYGYLSTGVEAAASEFLAAHPGAYNAEVGPIHAGHFLMLRRTS
jgi:O-methyltransferase